MVNTSWLHRQTPWKLFDVVWLEQIDRLQTDTIPWLDSTIADAGQTFLVIEKILLKIVVHVLQYTLSNKWLLKIMTLSDISLYILATPSNQRDRRNDGRPDESLQSAALANRLIYWPIIQFLRQTSRWIVDKAAGLDVSSCRSVINPIKPASSSLLRLSWSTAQMNSYSWSVFSLLLLLDSWPS